MTRQQASTTGTMDQLRGELPSHVWRVTLDTGEVAGYVTGDDVTDMLIHAARIKKLRHRSANLLRFQRLTIREFVRLRNAGLSVQ
jgi:hypothetical protein